MAVNYKPEKWTAVTPYITVDGAQELIDFLDNVFGITVIERIDGPNGTIGHCEVKLDDSILMISDACDKAPATRVGMYVYTPDVDAAYQRAIAAGTTSVQEPRDQFYGDRSAGIEDRWGNRWYMATHIEDVSPEELQRRAAQWAQQSQQPAEA